ncbi:MAG TPA: response regulator [Stellaceae bacterium]|nr:response regulator [Stellaceae bacterium]
MAATSQSEPRDETVLILAPQGRDAEAAAEVLGQRGIDTRLCATLDELCETLETDVSGAVILADEALIGTDTSRLVACLDAQPLWSDLPFLLLTRGTLVARQTLAALRLDEKIGNLMVLERPMHGLTLIGAVRTALRARRRQYQLRDYLEERERAEARLRQMQRLEAVGQLTAGIAHDFNNLLTAVMGNLELAQGRARDEAVLKLLRSALKGVERGAKLTAHLLSFSRQQRLLPRPVDINGLIEEMSGLLDGTLGGIVQIDRVLQSELWPGMVDPTQIEAAVLNLAINARDAMPEGGRILIETANVSVGEPEQPGDPPPGDYVAISVTDTGTGMSEEVLAHAFEPFFTTKGVGKGSGLGLAMVYGVARQSGGGVRIMSRLGTGTTVTIYLPRSQALPEPFLEVPRTARVDAADGESGIVLVVDDDDDVRATMAGMLEALGYRVVEAANGDAALEILDRERRIDLLLVDFVMPGMTGREVARRAQSKRPEVPILFVTGYDAPELSSEESRVDLVVHKPFRTAELAAKVERALRRRERPHSQTRTLPCTSQPNAVHNVLGNGG